MIAVTKSIYDMHCCAGFVDMTASDKSLDVMVQLRERVALADYFDRPGTVVHEPLPLQQYEATVAGKLGALGQRIGVCGAYAFELNFCRKVATHVAPELVIVMVLSKRVECT